MIQHIVQIGHSAGVIIPSDIRKQLGLKPGMKVSVDVSVDKRALMVTKHDVKHVSTITPHFLDVLERVNKRYGAAFAKLAHK